VAGAAAMSTRRSYQDYSAWPNYGTRLFWDEIETNPALAGELICQRLAQLGCINPSESCSGDITAGILVAMHGSAAGAFVTDGEVERMYHWVKVRLCTHYIYIYAYNQCKYTALAVTTAIVVYFE